MERRSDSRDFEDAYRRFEFAPLVTASLVIANWLKARRTAKPAEDRSAGSEDAFGGAHSPGKS